MAPAAAQASVTVQGAARPGPNSVRPIGSGEAQAVTRPVEAPVRPAPAALVSPSSLDPQLLKTVQKFREDELEHHDTGVEHQAEMTTGYVLLSKTIKQLCYTAIKISKKY